MSKLIRAVQNSKSLGQATNGRATRQQTPAAEVRRDKRQREASALLQQIWTRRA